MKCPETGFDCLNCEKRCDLNAKFKDVGAGRTVNVTLPASPCFDALGEKITARGFAALAASLHSMLAAVDRAMGPDACAMCKTRLVATAFVVQAHGAFDLGREDLCKVFAGAIADVLGDGEADEDADEPPLH